MPFSKVKAVTDFIHGRYMEDLLIVGDEDAPTSTVAGYLDRDITIFAQIEWNPSSYGTRNP